MLGRLDFSSGCLVAGQFGKTAGKFYPGGRKAFDPILIVFWVFPFRVVWGLFSSRKIRSRSRNGFPRVCVCRVVSGFRLSLCKLGWLEVLVRSVFFVDVWFLVFGEFPESFIPVAGRFSL